MNRLTGEKRTTAVIACMLFACSAATSNALPNLVPYAPPDWFDKIVVSDTTGTTIDVRNLVPTDTLYLDWALSNTGDAGINASFTVELYVDDVFRTFWTVSPPLPVDGVAAIQDYNLGSLGLGTHTLRLKCDATNSVPESDETDNEYTKTITVYGQKTYTITTSVSPPNAGIIFVGPPDEYGFPIDIWSGTVVTFPAGSFLALDVHSNPGFVFVNWTENGQVLTPSRRGMLFILDRDRNIVGNFNVAPPPTPAPTPIPSPAITVSSATPVVNEGQSAVFTIFASIVNPSQPVTVNYRMGGRASYGLDYILSGIYGQVTIPAGAASATVTLTALPDNLREKSQKAIMSLQPGHGYSLLKNRKASLTIVNVLPGPPPAAGLAP